MANAPSKRRTGLFAFVVLSVTVVGYFTGMQSPVRPQSSESDDSITDGRSEASNGAVLPSTAYFDMAAASSDRKKSWATNLTTLTSRVDPLEQIVISPQDKESALRVRDRNRAFNGAPPTIPHSVDQRSDRSCIACHAAGAKTASLRIPRMSHHFLANCTQCHVENNPPHMTASVIGENSFVGLPAPKAGPRAFRGAPPVVPHSTWMRSDCMSCHGPTGLFGIRTTHPWRRNCQQCHAPSASLNQSLLNTEPLLLPPPVIEQAAPPNGSKP